MILTNEVNSSINAFLASKELGVALSEEAEDIVVLCDPQNGKVFISRNPNSIDFIEVKDLNGYTVKSLYANSQLSTESYDISDLSGGIYIVGVGYSNVIFFTKQVLKNS